MSPKLQVSLLRVLQERNFARLGTTVQRASDFRLICATNKSLESEVKAGHFRSDLYYRINVMALHTPPLRERKEDIVPLALLFLDQFNRKFSRTSDPFTPEAITALEAAPWAGNVRELQNGWNAPWHRAQAGPITVVELGKLNAESATVDAGPLLYREARDEFEHSISPGCLLGPTECFEASRLSGLARSNFYHHVERFGLAEKS